MSLFDLQDVCIAIGSLATFDLPMVVDLIGIYVLKGPYCTLTMTDWFLQALSVIPRGSWGDVSRRFTMIRWFRFLGNAPSVPRTRAAAALRMKQIVLDNQSNLIRRLRAKLATERRETTAINKEHEGNQVVLEASHKTIAGLTEIGLSISKKIERMKAKKQQARESHMECHHKMQARIQEAEDTIQEQHLVIKALVEEKASLLQTIQGLQEENGASAPFYDEWEEEAEEDPEEEGLEDIPLGEGEIVEE
ncbi:acyl-CoA dehydrogenase-related protein [Dorcoceras hygrometricum]|uniref:Acyl-CoA dehydrogenase-related protein n=1 Tax=Dorcoceras hygrometricum TaxID=472368 RepID=A0A2Z7AHL8_9LAMI|nr:acyl-CoA dehydrogenase-related protein [Dorcoceras hygrometricum]